MGKQAPVERMKTLHERLAYHAHLYFVEDRQEISDDAYNDMEREFNDLCDQHPELAVQFEFANKPVPISDPTGQGLKQVVFTIPMLSLKKALSHQDVRDFLAGFQRDTAFFYEEKVDGIALELKYVKGKLVSIATRGAGMVGEDVTHSWCLFRPEEIPLELTTPDVVIPDELYLRGEGHILISDFMRYNELVDKKKSNPRNAVSGWIRAHKANQDKLIEGTLKFAIYWSSDEFGCDDYDDLRGAWYNMGFWPAGARRPDAVEHNVRDSSVPIDGIVIKLRDLEQARNLGSTSKFPRSAIAYKFPAEEGFPLVEDCVWDTSRFGRVIPVAKYTPIELNGVMCGGASLDNYSSFMELGLCVGDKISVTRNNDVIPRINGVVEPSEGAPLEAPTECPSCSSLLEVRVGQGSSDLICNNVSGCPAQITKRFVNTFDKFGLDVMGLGPITLSRMVDTKIVRVPADLFTAVPSQLLKYLDESTLSNLHQARHQPLWRFIKALGLPDIGIVLAKRIANCLVDRKDSGESVETLLNDVRFLTSIRGISSGTAMKVINAMGDSTFEENFTKLLAALVINWDKLPEGDLRICITGSTDQTREELVEYFANAGIELADKLTRDCKFVVVGNRPGQSKLLKATELDIPMLTLTDYSSIDQLIAYIKGN